MAAWPLPHPPLFFCSRCCLRRKVIFVTDSRKSTGTRGERETLDFLESRGYRIVDTNVRPEGGMARGEIDVVAWDGEFLVFCEVKTRRKVWGAKAVPLRPCMPVSRPRLRGLRWPISPGTTWIMSTADLMWSRWSPARRTLPVSVFCKTLFGRDVSIDKPPSLC